MIRPRAAGLFREVCAPRFGEQDLGRSPAGPQDRFAWTCARILLDESTDIRTWELVAPPAFDISEDCVGVVTGGTFQNVECSGRHIDHGTVFVARAGETLRFGIRRQGFRSILALRPLTSEAETCVGRERGDFREIATWPGPRGVLRVVPGPEADGISDRTRFLQDRWVTSLQSSDEGLRLEGGSTQFYRGTLDKMVSAPVSDGTVQLTPDGLLLLLRCRPTLGGYPRVFTVIDADVDLAAQIPPRRRVRFESVSLDEAVQLKRRQQEDVQRLRRAMGVLA